MLINSILHRRYKAFLVYSLKLDVSDLDMQDMSLVRKPPQRKVIGSSFDHKMTWMLHACLASRIYVTDYLCLLAPESIGSARGMVEVLTRKHAARVGL